MSADGSIASYTASPTSTGNVTDVAFGIDERFAAHTAAVIASVMHYGKGGPKEAGKFRFIIMHTGVTREMQQRIEAVAPGQAFVWIEVTDDDLPPFANRGHFTRATLFRMGLEKLAPADAKKIVYLDADITVLADVRKLAAIDLEGAPVGAVHDPNVDAPAFGAQWKPEGYKAGQGAYFNAGILLIDLAQVRAEGLFQKAIDFFAEHTTNLPWNDQDALNYALWGRWKHLDTAWNVQRSMAIATAAAQLPAEKRSDGKKPAIIHFTGGEKPWIAGAYHPWSHAYWISLKRTPFFNEVAAKQGVGAKERLKVLTRYLRWWPWTGKAI